MKSSTLRRLVLMAAATLGLAAGGVAQAGSVFLTGHDVDLHDGQAGYDVVILDYLRGAGTASEIAAASYRVGVLRSIDATNPASGFVGGVLEGAPLWAGGVTNADPTQFADAAAFTAFLGTIDVLVVASYVGCGGCDLSAGDSTVLNGFAAELATAFNAGLDIFGNSGDGLATYYDFLPPGAVATGTSIGGSSGFVCTAAGVAIGIDCDAGGVSNINGYPTHNRFSGFAAAFTVFETRPGTGGTTEDISIGIRDARIIDGGIVDGGTVPEPGVLALLGIGALGLALTRRRRRQ
jgi:hypothetical protein